MEARQELRAFQRPRRQRGIRRARGPLRQRDGQATEQQEREPRISLLQRRARTRQRSCCASRAAKISRRGRLTTRSSRARSSARCRLKQRKELAKANFRIDRSWIWRPIGNEDLVVLGGCAGLGTKPSCGILVVRIVLDRPSVLAWASSGHWVAAVHSDANARDVWLFGGDDLGSFRRLVSYVWGG